MELESKGRILLAVFLLPEIHFPAFANCSSPIILRTPSTFDDRRCYETNSRKYRKDRSMPLNSASSRGQPPLHYINEQFLDDTNDNTSFVYIGV